MHEPDLLLRITEEDQLFFIDDKSIAGAKTEFIASYDPVLHRITTPGFSLLNGKIQFNLEEYVLISFENKYSVCMEHPIKVSRELAKYGYQISVSTEFEGLSLAEQEILKKMGIEAAKNEKLRKHNLMVGTFVDLVNQNNYANEHGLEYNETIDWILKNPNAIIEDRELTREQTINGVTEINRIGEEFDPNLEQALLTDSDKERKDEEVLDVLLKGYKLKDRVIRPATVKINKLED